MATPTPGPWTAGEPAWFRGRRDESDGKRPITAGNSGVIANVYGEANAHLIAAAPDLLAACKEFVRKCDCGEARSVRSYAQMVAAIARAEGK